MVSQVISHLRYHEYIDVNTFIKRKREGIMQMLFKWLKRKDLINEKNCC